MRGVPTSRAYWELKADQVLNRVLETEAAIEVEVLERPPLHPSGPGVQNPDPPIQRSGLILSAVGVAGLILAGAALLLVGLWSQSQQSLRQERNLLMLERLRNLGPVAAEHTSPSPETSEATDGRQQQAPSAEGLPPPPPSEAWMQELVTLPSSGAPAPEPLRVPSSRAITDPPPLPPSVEAGDPPQLVGLVQVPGRSSSAIFQVGTSSTTARVGETIGSSGWRLVSSSVDSALIERGGTQRRVSIISGF